MGKSCSDSFVRVNGQQAKQLLQLLKLDWEKALEFMPQDLFGDFSKFMIRLLMEAEVVTRCGERHVRNADRQFVRHGKQQGSIVVHGGSEPIERPRIRTADQRKEVQVETYNLFSQRKALDEHALLAILAGVPTRHYAKLLERQLRKKGISKSTVSRRAIAATKSAVDQFIARRLDDLNIAILMLDGIHVGKRHLIVCIGIDGNGRKHLLAVRLGATENYVVCRDMVADMINRGLDPTAKYLFVIDGSQALSQTIKAAFGDDSAIQRCQEHKIRDVQGYLPVKHRKSFRAALVAAYNATSESQALTLLQNIRSQLSRISEQAMNSLTEGMLETVTLHRLGITGELRKSLRTTNIIESAFSAARRRMKNPVRHRSEASILGWTVRALLVAEKHFRILPGHRQIAKLQKNLSN
jgi:putative transposase